MADGGDLEVADGAGTTTGTAAPPVEHRLTDRIDRLVAGRWTLATTVLCVVAALAAWVVRFSQDDAFITYRYSRNLARGEGLVFNPGERVEGYTNFLWTWLHALPERWGWSSPVFSHVLGIALMVATVLVVLRLARRLFGSPAMAFLVALTMLANMSFLAYATGGLETMLQTLLVTSVAALLLPVGSYPAAQLVVRQLAAGVLCGLAVLTRLDSVVLLGTWVLAHLVAVWRRSPGADGPAAPDGGATVTVADRVGPALGGAVRIALPAAALVVPWLLWKLDYYGNLLPNTFYAKSAGSPLVPVLYGVFYLLCFFASYAAFLLVPRFRRLRHELFAVPGVGQVLVVVPVWCAYVCWVGGDFMEYRFMVVLVPVLAVVAAFLVDRYRSPRLQVLLVVTLLVFSGVHRVAPTVVPFPVLTFRELSHWPNESRTTWKGMGELLHDELGGGPTGSAAEAARQPVLAVEPLGVLPYFADLPTVDMLGLTDPGIAREGEVIGLYYPGHVRMATPRQLSDRGVDLVLGLPLLEEVDPGRTSYRLSELVPMWVAPDLRTLPDRARVVEIPLTTDSPATALVAVQLQPDPVVDAAVARNGWRTLPIERVCRDEDLNPFVRLVGTRTCPT